MEQTDVAWTGSKPIVQKIGRAAWGLPKAPQTTEEQNKEGEPYHAQTDLSKIRLVGLAVVWAISKHGQSKTSNSVTIQA